MDQTDDLQTKRQEQGMLMSFPWLTGLIVIKAYKFFMGISHISHNIQAITFSHDQRCILFKSFYHN